MNTTKLSDAASQRYALKMRVLEWRMERNWLKGSIWTNSSSVRQKYFDGLTTKIEDGEAEIRGLDDEAI